MDAAYVRKHMKKNGYIFKFDGHGSFDPDGKIEGEMSQEEIMTTLGEKAKGSRAQFILTLEHARNPDIDSGYWQPPVTPRKITMVITNLQEAQSSFNSWRDANGLGSGNMTKNSGKVTCNGRLVGRFSYNGRFWNSEGKEVVLASDYSLCAS